MHIDMTSVKQHKASSPKLVGWIYIPDTVVVVVVVVIVVVVVVVVSVVVVVVVVSVITGNCAGVSTFTVV